jgi:integrase
MDQRQTTTIARGGWMSAQEAATALSISPSKLTRTLDRHARAEDDGAIVAQFNGIVARKLGRSWRVRVDAFDGMTNKFIDRLSDGVTMAPRETRAVPVGNDMAHETATKQTDTTDKKQRKSTGVREEMRRGKRYLVIDFRYRIPDGSPKGKSARYRHDAEVQTWQGARAEYRRRLAAVAMTGSPFEVVDPKARAQVVPEPEPAGFTFGDAIDEWRADYVPTVKASTQRSFLQVADYRFAKFRGVPLVKMGAEQWRAVQASIREDGCCEGTAKAAGVVYRSILRFAVERKRIERLPDLPPLPRNATTELVTYTDDEVRALLDACTCGRHRLAVLLICYAGLRTSELRGLRRADMDPHARTITVRQAITLGPKKPNGASRLVKDKPKGRNERAIRMTEEMVQELIALGPLKPDELVCPNKDGKPWGHKGLYELWARLCKRAGVRRIARPVHAGRHYFGTTLCRARQNLRSAQKLLGHADLGMTQRYVHAVESDLETAMEGFEAYVMTKASARAQRLMVQPSGADVERSAESERRPIASRGTIDRDVESERRPALEARAT